MGQGSRLLLIGALLIPEIALCDISACIAIMFEQVKIRSAKMDDRPDAETVALFEAPPPPMEYEERDAVVDWARGNSINLALRGQKDHTFKDVPMTPKLTTLIKWLDSALHKLVRYSGVSFRGHQFVQEELDAIKVGGVFEDKGFLTSSVSYWQAMSFTLSRFSFQRPALLVFRSNQGRIIPQQFYHRKEYEIIFPLLTRFEVLEIDRSKQPVHIYLRELPD